MIIYAFGNRKEQYKMQIKEKRLRNKNEIQSIEYNITEKIYVHYSTIKLDRCIMSEEDQTVESGLVETSRGFQQLKENL